MKKIFLLLLGAIGSCFAFPNPSVLAAEQVSTILNIEEVRPSCVLMKFTNATRYRALDSDSVFADLVMEKLLASHQFNFMEAHPLDEDLETLLYDKNHRISENIATSQKEGNLDALFNGEGFNKKKAWSIHQAQVGQFLDPTVTAAIGREHGADYLIQGSIVSIGSDQDENSFSLGFTFKSEAARIGVVGDLRIIRAATGEVLWMHRATGEGKQGSTSLGNAYGENLIKVGKAKLNANLYARAMDDAAQKLVDAMIDDMKKHRIFFLNG